MESYNQLLINFINKYCSGEISNLLMFDFANIANDLEFGCPNRSFDCDDTNIIRIIFYLLYKNKLKDLSIDKIGTGRAYRGDTINSFNTIFGRKNTNGHFEGIEKYTKDLTFLAKVESFYKIYHTIGNFCLLPNNSYNNITINLYRGINSWKDYFDLFIIELKKCLENSQYKDKVLNYLINANEIYFKHINFNINKFVELNYLENYSISNTYTPYLYHWKFRAITNEIKEEYVKFADNYIKISTNLIFKRGELIIKELSTNVLNKF